MKVLQINTFGNLSTGNIAVDLYRTLLKNGHDGKVAFARNTIKNDVPYIKIGTSFDYKLHGLMTRITDRTGFYSIRATKKLISDIEEYNPDIIHLHNLHGYYINIEILFEYLKSSKKPVIWTLHDCWAFTGHCAHFDFIGCKKWLTGCNHCIQKKEYPSSFIIDSSVFNYEAKKNLFTSIENMVLISPSQWLADLVKQSFLGKYQIKVIRNGIDLEVFKPTYSGWVERNHLEDKKIILGVAGTWSKRKGLDDLIKLSSELDDNYKIVIVGLNSKQVEQLPKNILGIERTFNREELAEIYTAAEFFINPTYEDNFPTVNLEALACGTPVITYNTGGSVESIHQNCGVIVSKGDIQKMKNAIVNNKGVLNDCLETAKLYDKNKVFEEYIYLYNKLLKL